MILFKQMAVKNEKEKKKCFTLKKKGKQNNESEISAVWPHVKVPKKCKSYKRVCPYF